MYDLTELRERLRSQRPVPWDQLPDFSLYMDQVLSYMDRQVIRFDEDDGLTAAMVNNYTKSGLVPRAEGKKYSRDHAPGRPAHPGRIRRLLLQPGQGAQRRGRRDGGPHRRG